MKKRFVFLAISAMLILLATVACQAAPAQPALISVENAAQLAAAVQVPESRSISDLVWSSDSSVLVALSGDGALRLDSKSLETLDSFTYDSPASIYAASSNGKTLAFSQDNFNIYLTNMSETSNACTIYSPDMIGVLDISPDGQTLLTTSMDEIKVTLWDINSGAELQTFSDFETAAPVYSARFGEDGKHIIWVARGTVQLSEIDTQAMSPVFSHEDFVSATALSPDGSLLVTAAAGTVNGEFQPIITLWDTTSGQASATLTYPEAFSTVTFSPDGSLLAASSGSTIIVWNVATSQQLVELENSGESVIDLTFSPDGTSLAAAALDGNITLWQVK